MSDIREQVREQAAKVVSDFEPGDAIEFSVREELVAAIRSMPLPPGVPDERIGRRLDMDLLPPEVQSLHHELQETVVELMNDATWEVIIRQVTLPATTASMPLPDLPGVPDGWQGARYRHKKRGTTYEIVSDVAMIEVNMEQAVVYRCIETGQVWVRPYAEFFDGRFEAIPAAPLPPASTSEKGGEVEYDPNAPDETPAPAQPHSAEMSGEAVLCTGGYLLRPSDDVCPHCGATEDDKCRLMGVRP